MDNVDVTLLEDAIVNRLDAVPILTGRVFAVASPTVDLSQFPTPPVVLLMATDETISEESSPLGQELKRKFDLAIEVLVVASHFRSRGDLPGAHSINAVIKDALMAFMPDVPSLTRPLVYDGGRLLDVDEERRLLVWLQEWSTLLIVRQTT